MALDAARMSRMRAAEKEARRTALRQAREREARENVAPVVIRFPVDTAHRIGPAERAHLGPARRTAHKARDVFARAMREARACDDAMMAAGQSREAERDG